MKLLPLLTLFLVCSATAQTQPQKQTEQQVLSLLQDLLQNDEKALFSPFTQQDQKGTSTGTLILSSQGRFRFSYHHPTPMTIISDGIWIAIEEDGFLQRYPLSSSPLSVLKRKDIKPFIKQFSFHERLVTILLAHPKDPQAPSVTLNIETSPLTLLSWTINTPHPIIVLLTNPTISDAKTLPISTFFIDYDKYFHEE